MMKVSPFIIVLLWLLCFGSVSVLAYDPEQELPEEENTQIVEIEEGVYQVYDESDSESGDVDVSSEYESSSGSYNGEVDNGDSTNEGTTEEGNSDLDASETETDTESTEQVEDDRLNTIISEMNTLHDDFLKLLISIWVLSGLYLGTKLIKGLFGYYG